METKQYQYCAPRTRVMAIETDAVLDMKISVDPSEEGNQEEAEATQGMWDDTSTTSLTVKSLWEE